MSYHLLPIIIYSKFSPSCKKLFELITNKSDFELVCIDHPKIRNRITKDTKICIKMVPTILICHENGKIEKYEGINSFKLIQKDVVEKLPEESITEVESAVDADAAKVKKNVSFNNIIDINNNTTSILNLEEEDEEEQKNEIKSVVKKPSKSESLLALAKQMEGDRNLEEKQLPRVII